MKQGYKTTEFWITIGIQIVGILVTAGVFTPDQASAATDIITKVGGLIAMGAGAFGYSLSRGSAKKNQK